MLLWLNRIGRKLVSVSKRSKVLVSVLSREAVRYYLLMCEAASTPEIVKARMSVSFFECKSNSAALAKLNSRVHLARIHSNEAVAGICPGATLFRTMNGRNVAVGGVLTQLIARAGRTSKIQVLAHALHCHGSAVLRAVEMGCR